ncbi:TSUP family transporter [Anaeromyxobacter terrae]|uniref:TSUP family transporter n=1 Tax=Anaeromyxobacter terrae TaxID=2925406 RepID=UPI001F56E856|nr:TSUP family transporter [Anaeromyxobacter sp. SG22]
MVEPGLPQIAILTLLALVAGVVDAIAGGGGLLTVPAILWAGLPPHLALGTNKGQSVFGSFAALVRFTRGGLVDGRRARITFPLGLAGSLGGAALVLATPPSALRPIVVALLAFAALFVGLRRGPRPGLEDAPAPRNAALLAGVIALAIGAYDGFFGPGTGTFLIVAFVALLGDGLAHASASAKVVNFASNLAAVALFASRGVVVWRVALPMAAAQLAGGWVGAHLAIRRGDALIRRVVVAVALVLAAKLAWDMRGP